jgi:glycosyltransferase involved in cell wall biosynthesis
MRILLVHGYYKERGGEDVAFETDAKLLEDAGHEVRTLPFHNTEIGEVLSLRDRLGLAASTVWSRTSADRVAAAVAAFQPDVVHFHNTFPLISPAAFSAAGRQGAPVVATLHNYRLVCANANLYRDGAVCEDCVGKAVPFPSIQHACYRGGRAESAVVASMQVAHRARRTWTRDVDRFITPSAFARAKLIQAGLPADRVTVRSNAVMPATPGGSGQREGFIYAGRLAPNKGITTLLEAWRARDDMPVLRIAGDGEMAPEVHAAAATNPAIEYLGPLSHDEVANAMSRSIALVVPSTWYEIQGLVILEAFSCATPVIASNIGAIPEAVLEGVSGLLFQPGDASALTERVRWASTNSDAMRSMGSNALARYQSDYSPERSLAQLIEVYELAGAERRTQRRAGAQLEPV